jgi:hypothetical protein
MIDVARFGIVRVYFDVSAVDDVAVVRSADLYFDHTDSDDVYHVQLLPHVGVYGVGRPWMTIQSQNAWLHIYSDAMRSVMWYECSLIGPNRYLQSGGSKFMRLVGAIPQIPEWRAWHYRRFFGVNNLHMGS